MFKNTSYFPIGSRYNIFPIIQPHQIVLIHTLTRQIKPSILVDTTFIICIDFFFFRCVLMHDITRAWYDEYVPLFRIHYSRKSMRHTEWEETNDFTTTSIYYILIRHHHARTHIHSVADIFIIMIQTISISKLKIFNASWINIWELAFVVFFFSSSVFLCPVSAAYSTTSDYGVANVTAVARCPCC